MNLTPSPSIGSKSKSKGRYTSSTQAAGSEPPASNSDTRFVGCYTSEVYFSDDKQYIGGDTGSSFGLASYAAANSGKRYFAIARAETDGHVFTFDRLLSKPNRSPDSAGCNRPCTDIVDQRCGCVDDLCNDPTPANEEHNRRWAVYEMVEKSSGGGGAKSSQPRKKNSKKQRSS